MCRWFAFLSPEEPCLLSDVLITPANSIARQVSDHYLPYLLPHKRDRDLHRSKDALIRARNALLNMDGVGISWYTDAAQSYSGEVDGLRPALYKSQSPPINDFNFRSLCSNIETTCVFAHIRASSGTPVTQINNHPFVFGRHVFMHNGTVTNFLDIKREMVPLIGFDAFCNVHGSTDSENMAALYITNLTNNRGKETWEHTYTTQEMFAALTKTITQIMELQKSKLGSKHTPNSLNLCTTDGTKMVAFRFRNHATEQPPSLYWSDSAGQKLNGKFPQHPDAPEKVVRTATMSEKDKIGKHVIIASEPTTYDEKEWHLIPANHAFCVDDSGKTEQRQIVYDVGLNAEDPEQYDPTVAELGH